MGSELAAVFQALHGARTTSEVKGDFSARDQPLKFLPSAGFVRLCLTHTMNESRQMKVGQLVLTRLTFIPMAAFQATSAKDR